MKLNEKKLLIFDLDGTLSDTIGAITEAVNLTLKHFSYPEKSEEQVRKAIGNGARILIKRLIPEEAAQDDAKVSEALRYYNEMYGITYMHTTDMYDGVREAVTALYEQGIKIAVLSNKQDAYVKGLVNMYFPGGEVAIAKGQTDIPIKPDPAGVMLILSELGISGDECAFVGDSNVDVKTARNSDMDFIGVSWGFGGRKELVENGAEIIVDHPSEIANLLKK